MPFLDRPRVLGNRSTPQETANSKGSRVLNFKKELPNTWTRMIPFLVL